MIGKTVGHYRITSKLGAGGMGEVFLAEDTRLERKAAIKFLPAELAADPERRQRFLDRGQGRFGAQSSARLHRVRRGRDGRRAAVYRHGIRGRPVAGCGGETEDRSKSPASSRSPRRWPTRWMPPMPAGSCIATSSRPTSVSTSGAR